MSDKSISILNVEQFFAFQTKRTPGNTLILFNFSVRKFWRVDFTANAALII